jgi:hypothetical protein
VLAVNVDGMVFRLHDREHLARADVMSNIAFCVPITAFVVVGALIDEGILFDGMGTFRVDALRSLVRHRRSAARPRGGCVSPSLAA